MDNNDENIETNIKLMESEDTKEGSGKHEYSGGLNIKAVLLSSLMLIGPLLMGITIASIGNDKYIKQCFYTMHFQKPNEGKEKVDAVNFPPAVWSLGFLYPFGGWFGSIIGAMTVDKYGRKNPSLLFCIFAILGAVFKFLSRYIHIGLLFLSRFFDGISTSGLMVSAVLLLFETLPNRLEKYYKSFIQISVNMGIMMIGVVSLYSIVNENWNYVHLMTLGLSLLLTICVLIIPESPKFIYNTTKDEEKTEQVLRSLRGANYNHLELENIKKAVAENANLKQMSIKEFLEEKNFRFATISLIVLHLGQQLCGINSIMAFAPSLLETAGFKNPDVSGVIITSVGLVGSIIFAPIVGTLRRKLLWLIGFFFMLVSFVCFIICQIAGAPSMLSLFFLCLFVFMFQIGPGPVCWFISVEMFPINAIGAAQGIAGFFNWFANTLVFLLFPILEKAMSFYVLIIFIVFQTIVIIYSYFFVIETYNRSAQEVLEDYQKLHKF